jgi:hypothetical protein
MHVKWYSLLSACLLSNLTLTMNKDYNWISEETKKLHETIETIRLSVQNRNIADGQVIQSILSAHKKTIAQLANGVVNQIEQSQGREKNLYKSKL